MTTPHRALPQEWDAVQKAAQIVGCSDCSCLMELRDRVEALEERDALDAEAWTAMRRSGSELRSRLAAAEQRISELEGNHPAKPDSSAPAVEPPKLDTNQAFNLWNGPGTDESAFAAVRRIYRAGWDAAMAAATCPHIRSSDEGTSYCALAEASAGIGKPPEPANTAPTARSNAGPGPATPKPVNLFAQIDALLDGIDRDECHPDGGWWETSDGTKFGRIKLRELKELIAASIPLAQPEPIGLTDIVNELEGNHPAKPDSSAPTVSLVERVRTAIVEHGDGFTCTVEARAAIRAVAAAAKDLRFSRAETLIDWLEREAKRG